MRRRLPDLLIVMLLAVLGTMLLLGGGPAQDRADALAERLRCPVCQSESVADSRSDTAIAMQERIDQLIDLGQSDEQIIDHFVDRYGEWILLAPPFDARSAALWLLPPFALLAALVALLRWRRAGPSGDNEFPPEHRRRLDEAVAALRRRERSS